MVRSFEEAAGDRAIRNTTAAQDFMRLRSREPSELTYDEVGRIEIDVQAANRNLGSGKLVPGQREFEKVEGALSGERGDAYRRSHARVQTLWDTCTMLAMLLERAKRPAEASIQMAHCVHAYPSFRPDAESEIQPLFDSTITGIPSGILRVGVREGCVVRANGMDLGRLPLDVTLPVDNYRVQLDCVADGPGRVHSLELQEGANQFTVDPLDFSVHTNQGLWLKRSETTDSDAHQLGSVLGATVVLLVAEGDSVRARVGERDIALLAPGDDVQGIIALLEPPVKASDAVAPLRSMSQTPTPLATHAPETFEPVSRSSSLVDVAGVGLLVAGAGSLAVGWILYAQRYSLRNREYERAVPFASRDRFADLGTGVLDLSGLGALLLTAAEPILVAGDGIPTVAWIIAAGGLAMVGTGIGFGLGHHCEPHVSSTQLGEAACGFAADATFGPLLALHGLPLLALPAMYRLRQLVGGESTVVLGFDGRGGHLVVGGSF